jgi:hypothetical protein
MSKRPTNPTGKGGFKPGRSGNPGGRPRKAIGDLSAEKKAVTKTAPAAKTAPAPVPVAKNPPPGVVEVTEPLENFGGSRSDDWNNVIACQVVNALWVHTQTREKQIRAALAGLEGIGPKTRLRA